MKYYEYESIHDDTQYKIRVGENAQENWDLIDDASQNDIWFHVSDHPSCHVVLSIDDNKTYPHKTVINHCASLCKEGSKVSNRKNIKIIYTEIKNVKKGDKTGSVSTKNTKIVKV